MTSDPAYWTGRAGKGRWGSLPPALYQAQGVFPRVACRPILGKPAKLGRLGARFSVAGRWQGVPKAGRGPLVGWAETGHLPARQPAQLWSLGLRMVRPRAAS